MPSDAFFGNVVLLLSAVGADGDTTFEDDSTNAHPLTAQGDAQVDTDVTVFGENTFLSDGNTDFVQAADDDDWHFGSGDFTIESWIYFAGTPGSGQQTIIAQDDISGSNRGWSFQYRSSKLEAYYSPNGTTFTQLHFDDWPGVSAGLHHVVWERAGSVSRVYADGVMLGKATLTGSLFNAPTPLTIGAQGVTGFASFNGNLFDTRITKGVARYNSDVGYAVPILPFPRSAFVDTPGASAEVSPTTTIAAFMKMEMPGRVVQLCDGGMLDYAGSPYFSEDDVYGSVHTPGAITTGFGDLAESANITLAPKVTATVSDWWRDDLGNSRVRMWIGEVGSDNYSITSATQMADLLVDTTERQQGLGEDLLSLELIGRAEKLFLKNEGNVCAQRFHQTVWSGEKGFNNCTDLIGYLAWGAATPPRGSSGTSGTSSSAPRMTFAVSG